MDREDKPILIIGGGMSGITTAIEIAETGKKVVLIEKLPYLGGRVIKMNNYFPKLCPPACGLEINFSRIKRNANIKIMTSSTVEKLSGSKGNFMVQIRTSAQYINSNCTACGDCANVCPVERDNEFNYGLDKTRAAYIPHEMAFPWKYTIDTDVCLGRECSKCKEVCAYDAIDLSCRDKEHTLRVASIVFATGWMPYDASRLENLNYANHPDIITNVEMERLLAPNGPTKGKLQKFSDGKVPKSVAFVQCAGSRDENHLPWCSAVCCSASLKHAMTIAEHYSECIIQIFYIDIRVTGRNEDFLKKAEKIKNIRFIKGKVGKIDIKDKGQKLELIAEDILTGIKTSSQAELVVLATGMQPDDSVAGLVKGLNRENPFIINEWQEDGIYAVACARKPMDVSASLKDATGIALKAIQAMKASVPNT